MQRLLPQITRRVVTYGRHSEADYCVSSVAVTGLKTNFELCRPQSRPSLTINLNMPGEHNALNAAAAAAVATELGLPEGKQFVLGVLDASSVAPSGGLTPFSAGGFGLRSTSCDLDVIFG